MLTIHTIRQLLEVLRLFREKYLDGVPLRKSYTSAVDEVAKRYSVTYQTIGDGCRRRLELENINDLYEMLSAWMKGNGNPLLQQLKKHSDPVSHGEIEQLFVGGQSANSPRQESSRTASNHDESVTFSFRLQPADARLLRALAELEGKSVGELTGSILLATVKDRMKGFLK